MWNTVLFDQLDPTNPEDAEVRAIILRVQQKALRNADFEDRRVIVPSKERVTDSKGEQNGGADEQKS